MDIKTLKNVISMSKNEIYIILFYSAIVGLLSLVLPIAAQGLVTIVSFGSLRQPLFILSFAVFILLTVAAIFRLLQNILLEIFQQKIFAVNALKVARRLPRLKLFELENYQSGELLNRFFDVVTIQKSVTDILLNFTTIILQSILGMILLAIYHPALLVFDIIYIFSLALAICLPFKSALMTAYDESSAKYEVVGWLEEMLRVPFLFHFQGIGEFGVKKADKIVTQYIQSKKNHYRHILQHLCSTYIIQILGSTSLLLVGGLLVLKNQMTLGQLVAAEIIVTSLGNSTIKVSGFLQKIYDLFAAAEKLNLILQLPIESNHDTLVKEVLVNKEFESAPLIQINHLKIINNHENNYTNLTVYPKENIVFMGYKQLSANNLMLSMLGMRESNQLEVKYNDIPVQYYAIKAFRKKVCYINHPEIFHGSIIENLILDRHDIPLTKIIELTKSFNLHEKINKLDRQFDHQISGVQQIFTNVDLLKIVLIRACLTDPYLLFIDGALDILSSDDMRLIAKCICGENKKWTLIATTNRNDIADFFDKRIVL